MSIGATHNDRWALVHFSWPVPLRREVQIRCFFLKTARNTELSTAAQPWSRFMYLGTTVMHLSNESLLVIIVVGIIAGWLAGRVTEGGGFGFNWRSDSRPDRCIYWRLAATATWYPPRRWHYCSNHQRIYRCRRTPADPSARWRLGLQTPLALALVQSAICARSRRVRGRSVVTQSLPGRVLIGCAPPRVGHEILSFPPFITNTLRLSK